MGEVKQKEQFLDSAWIIKGAAGFISLSEARKAAKTHQTGQIKSTLFSRGRRTESFFTEDSRLYVTPHEYRLAQKGTVLRASVPARKLDGISARILYCYQDYRPAREDFLVRKLEEKYENLRDSLSLATRSFFGQFLSPARIWNFTVVGAILFGMVSMTFIYRYLGQGASAENARIALMSQTETANQPASVLSGDGQILGAEKITENLGSGENKEDIDYILQIMQNLENGKKEEFEKEVRSMVKGYPIERMIPYIMDKDRIVVAFLIGIARKESSWGVHVPLLNGQDCYNYWGYKGKRKLMGTGGHTCFNSRKDAVDTVAKRIEWLIKNRNLNTPGKMVIWKCGSACNQDDQWAVQKWISDVNLYFQKLND